MIVGQETIGKLRVRECMEEGFGEVLERVLRTIRMDERGFTRDQAVMWAFAGLVIVQTQDARRDRDSLMRSCLLLASMDYTGESERGLVNAVSVFPGILGLVQVWEFGRTVHEPRSWQKVPAEAWLDALWRHLLKSGHEAVDAESGLPHSYHMLWNALAYDWAVRNREEEK